MSRLSERLKTIFETHVSPAIKSYLRRVEETKKQLILEEQYEDECERNDWYHDDEYAHRMNFDYTRPHTEDYATNPATGLTMIGGAAEIDVGGNGYGSSFQSYHYDHYHKY